jgi:hypothetical protein
MSNTLPEATVAAFGTLCGATVAMVEAGLLPGGHPTQPDQPAFTWKCLGCSDGNSYPRDRGYTRQQANDHAGSCRSQPLPAN